MKSFRHPAKFFHQAIFCLVLLFLIAIVAIFNPQSVQAHGNIDQTFTTNPTSFAQACSGVGGFKGQTFIPHTPANNIIGFDLHFFGASSNGTVFSITSWPNISNVLGSVTSPGGTGLVHFDLSAQIPLNIGQKYAIVKTGGPDTCFRASSFDPNFFYQFGGAITHAGNEDVGVDLAFKTYYAPDSIAPSVGSLKIITPGDGAFVGSETVGFTGPSLIKSQPITITGKVFDNTSLSSVTVNGVAATIVGDDFTLTNLPLNVGTNSLTLVAKDIWSATTTLEGQVTYSTDGDEDGIANNIDGNCTTGSPFSEAGLPTNRFCDTIYGGATIGFVGLKSAGVSVKVTNATPEPQGVNLEVTGPAGGTADLHLFQKGAIVTYDPGTYVLTDPDKTIKVEVITGHAEIKYQLDGVPFLIAVENASAVEFVEHENGNGTVRTLSGNVSVNGTNLPVGSAFNIGETTEEDTTDPTVNIFTPENNAFYLLNQVVNADYSCSDSQSGVLSCIGSVPVGSAIQTASVGLKTFNVTGTDNASNSDTVAHTYSVVYDWSKFSQPINLDNSSIFKLGSTVPVKFQLINESSSVSNAIAKLYVAKIDNGIEGSISEAVSNASADSGNTFRYDPNSQQYVFNLGTKSLTTGTYKLKIYIGGDNNTGVLQGEINISLK